MPASVVFAQYIGAGQGNALAPSTVEVWRGNWEKNYAGISRKSEALHHDDGKFKVPVRRTVQPRTHHRRPPAFLRRSSTPHSDASSSQHDQHPTPPE